MRLIIEKNYDAMSQWAAEHVIEKINAFKPTAEKPFVLGLPTGSSPEGMYACLVKAVKEGRIYSACCADMQGSAGSAGAVEIMAKQFYPEKFA